LSCLVYLNNLFVPNKNRKLSNEQKEKCKIYNKEKRSRKVNQYDMDGKFLKKWKNMSDACAYLNKPNRQGDITLCCQGIQKTAFGFIWKYAD
jgi:hypothetical protein